MAGTIIADTIQAQASSVRLNVGSSIIASLNSRGIYSNTGNLMIAYDGTLGTSIFPNTSLVGNIVSSQIASVANTAIVGRVANSQMHTGAVLQVQQATLTDVFSTNSNGVWVDVTNLSVTITPLSSSSKFLLIAQTTMSGDLNSQPSLRFYGGNSTNYIGNGRGIRRRVGLSLGNDIFNGTSSTVSSQIAFPCHLSYLDSPSTASPITYKLQAMSDSNGGLYLNRDAEDPDSSGEGWTGASSLIVMEIAG